MKPSLNQGQAGTGIIVSEFFDGQDHRGESAVDVDPGDTVKAEPPLDHLVFGELAGGPSFAALLRC